MIQMYLVTMYKSELTKSDIVQLALLTIQIMVRATIISVKYGYLTDEGLKIFNTQKISDTDYKKMLIVYQWQTLKPETIQDLIGHALENAKIEP